MKKKPQKDLPVSPPADILNLRRIYEIRLQNLNIVIPKYQQEEGVDTLREFARVAGVKENLLTQIRTGNRNIGDALAKKLEENLHLGRGWMDNEHQDWTAETVEERVHLAQFRAVLRRLSPADQRKAIRQYAKLVDLVTKPQRTKKK